MLSLIQPRVSHLSDGLIIPGWQDSLPLICSTNIPPAPSMCYTLLSPLGIHGEYVRAGGRGWVSTNKQAQHVSRVISAPKETKQGNVRVSRCAGALMGRAEGWGSPKPTIPFGFGVVVGEERVMSQVDLEGEEELDRGRSGSKSEQEGPGRPDGQSGCGSSKTLPLKGVEWRRQEWPDN